MPRARTCVALVLLWAFVVGCSTDRARPSDGAPIDPARPDRTEPIEQSTRNSPQAQESGGRWRKLRVASNEDSELEMQVRQLEALGYASGTQTAPSSVGVTVHDRARAQPGLNLSTSGHAAEAELITMDGHVVHRWRFDFEDAWPDDPVGPLTRQSRFWRRAQLFPNGDLLAIYEGLGLIKLDKDSKLLWARRNGAHHDLHVLPNGDVAVLTRKRTSVPNPFRIVAEDFVTVLSPDGETKAEYSVLEAFERSREHRRIWKTAPKQDGDIFHTNSIEVLDGRFADRNPALASGNYLLSSRTLSTVFVIDPRRNEVVWSLRGTFKEQHDPQMLPDGRLMLFDNQGRDEASAVQVYDPATGELQWEFRGTDEQPFYTKSCGTAQRLPNGNTLVTESDNGRAFELADDDTVVWAFYNPHRAGERDEYIATLFFMERFSPAFPTEWAHGPSRR